MTRHASIALVLLLGGACRIGGPNGEATTLVEVDASLPEGGSEPVLDARPAELGTGNTQPAPGDASPDDAAPGDPAPSDAAIDDAAIDDAAIDDAATGDAAIGDAAPGDGATSNRLDANCDPPSDLECDPVSGEGCLPFTQCLAGSSSAAASCVFGGIQLGATCTQDELGTDCPPQHTCVMGVCREYCYCDADCENGAACEAPSGEGSTRFRLCKQTSAP
jgi:hypothetical protein